MRTTVTLDRDVERLLREAMHRSRSGFKQALNAAIRAGLGQSSRAARNRPFVLKARPLGLRAGVDPAAFNQLADELEVDAFLAKSRSRGGQMIIPDINLLLYKLLEDLGTAGNLVSDAQMAALAMDYDAVLHTADADFMRFHSPDRGKQCERAPHEGEVEKGVAQQAIQNDPGYGLTRLLRRLSSASWPSTSSSS